MPCHTRKRVVPSESTTSIVEIRPSRFLRVQHHNPRERDENFSREMSLFMQYKKSGIPASGPLTMPKSKRFSKASSQQSNQNAHDQYVHPLATDTNDNSGILQCSTSHGMNIIKESSGLDSAIPSMPASKSSSVLSSPVHNVDSDKVRSASSVQVAMHNIKRLNEIKSNPHAAKCIVKNDSETISNETQKQDKLDNGVAQSKSNGTIHNQTAPLSPDSLNATSPNTNAVTEIDAAQNELFDLKASVTDLVIFLIHGVGGSSDIWCAQIQHFVSQGYEVVAPDLIGHGFSCCPKTSGAYHFKEIAADMEEFFDRYCKRRNVIIGHSYGASFATLLARNRSRRVYKLALVSGGPPTPLAPQPGVFNLPVCMLGCIKPCLVCGFKKGAFHKKRKSVLSKTEAFNIPTYVLQHTMNGQIWPDGDEFYHNWLTCPTLLIYGADDKLVTLDEELHMEEAIFNSHLVVINDASHMVMIEAPDEVNELLSNFIQHVPDTRNSRQGDGNSHIQSQQQPYTSRQMPEITLKRSLSRISQKSLRSAKSQRSLSVTNSTIFHNKTVKN